MKRIVSFKSPHRKQSEKGTRNCFHLAFSSLAETSLCYPPVHCPSLSVGLFFSLSPIWNSKNSHRLTSAFPRLLVVFLFRVPCTPLSLSTSLSICLSLTPLLLLSWLFHAPRTPLSLSTSLNISLSLTLLLLLVLLSSSPCLSHPPPPMFPSGDPLSIHHYFHGYLAGFTVRPGSLESREVIECLYACREGLDYSDFDSLGKGMKVRPSAQLAWVSSTLLPSLASQDFACSPASDHSPPFSLVSLLAWTLGICQGTPSIFFSSTRRFT